MRKDGSLFWASVTISALRNSDGELMGFTKVTRDLSAKREEEAKLRESERNLRLLITSVQDYAIFSLSPEGIITSWNLGAERIKGYAADEAIGQHFSIFYPPELVARGAPRRFLMQAADEGHFQDEGWRVRKDGSRMWASVTITAIRDDAGTLLGFSKVTRDLTERRTHEEALREREENLRLLVEGVKDHAMFLLDPEGRIRTWNAGAQQTLGYSSTEVLQRDVSVFYTPEDRASGRFRSELVAAKAAGFFQIEGWRQRADGSRFWAHVATTHVQDEDGTTRGFVRIVRDLTERRRVEALEAEGRRIAEFIAMLSHELRNPLAPMRNAMTILAKLVDNPQAAWCIELVGRQIAHMTRLIDDLMDVSRITSGKVRLEPVQLELNTLVRMAVDSGKSTVKSHGHSLTLHLANKPIPLVGDATRLTQVVLNLLNNAAKYTPAKGRINITVLADDQLATLQVTDNGIGMNEALLQNAFEPFVQGARSLDRAEGGLGIGLTLVRSIVELHGGAVTAASAGPGKGTTFTVTLPILVAEQGAAVEEVVETVLPAGRRILVVDDNTDSAESLAVILRFHGHDVQVALDGPRALGIAASMRPDTAVVDIGLPGMDGYEVARRLRELPGMADVQLIALTGYGQDADRQAAYEAGFSVHLTKPVDPDEVGRLIK